MTAPDPHRRPSGRRAHHRHLSEPGTSASRLYAAAAAGFPERPRDRRRLHVRGVVPRYPARLRSGTTASTGSSRGWVGCCLWSRCCNLAPRWPTSFFRCSACPMAAACLRYADLPAGPDGRRWRGVVRSGQAAGTQHRRRHHGALCRRRQDGMTWADRQGGPVHGRRRSSCCSLSSTSTCPSLGTAAPTCVQPSLEPGLVRRHDHEQDRLPPSVALVLARPPPDVPLLHGADSWTLGSPCHRPDRHVHLFTGPGLRCCRHADESDYASVAASGGNLLTTSPAAAVGRCGRAAVLPVVCDGSWPRVAGSGTPVRTGGARHANGGSAKGWTKGMRKWMEWNGNGMEKEGMERMEGMEWRDEGNGGKHLE